MGKVITKTRLKVVYMLTVLGVARASKLAGINTVYETKWFVLTFLRNYDKRSYI